jgi:hypothetical protein
MGSDEPLATATTFLADLKDARARNDPSLLGQSPTWDSIKRWLPDSPEKLAAWIIVLEFIISSLTKAPEHNITKKEIINSFNQTIPMLVFEQTTSPPTLHNIDKAAPKPKRNAPYLCGSGKKYKHCCGRLKR